VNTIPTPFEVEQAVRADERRKAAAEIRAIAKDERIRSFTVETGGAKARERAKGLRRAANIIDPPPDGGFALQLAQRGIDEMTGRVASNSDVRKRIEQAETVARVWNFEHPVGTRVLAKLLVSEVIGATTSPAYTRHTAVLVDVGAYEAIALERIVLMSEVDQ